MNDDLPLVLIIEDSPFVQFAWRQRLTGNARVEVFASPSELLSDTNLLSDLLIRAQVIVIDLHFNNHSTMDGLQLAKHLRSVTSAKLILSTEADLDAHSGDVDLVLRKDPCDFSSLKRLLKI